MSDESDVDWRRMWLDRMGRRRHPNKTRAKAADPGADRCPYCDEFFTAPPTRDHIVPVARGGRDHSSNVVLACQPCNHAKANKLLSQMIFNRQHFVAMLLQHARNEDPYHRWPDPKQFTADWLRWRGVGVGWLVVAELIRRERFAEVMELERLTWFPWRPKEDSCPSYHRHQSCLHSGKGSSSARLVALSTGPS